MPRNELITYIKVQFHVIQIPTGSYFLMPCLLGGGQAYAF